MIKILCDVCADIPVEVAAQCDILCLPMTLTVNDVERTYTAERSMMVCAQVTDAVQVRL